MNRKIISLLLTLAMLLGCASMASAEDDPYAIMPIGEDLAEYAPLAGEPTAGEEVAIIFANDIHCGVDDNAGYVGLAAYVAEAKAAYGEDAVWLVDAGDAIQGAAIGTLSRGEYIVDIMNEMGYTVAVPGNHEFDYGMERFLELAEMAEYSYLAANFVDLTTGEPVFEGCKLVESGDTTVAFIGISTPESLFKSTPKYFQNAEGEYIYSFCGDELYAVVQESVDEATAAGADYVVAVGHLGIDPQSAPWRSVDVIENTTGIDAFIDGHSHSVIAGELIANAEGEDVVLLQTGTKLANIGKLVINTVTGELSYELVSGYEGKDEATAEFIDGIKAEYGELINDVVASTEVDLLHSTADEYSVRVKETNLGDLVADAYRVLGGADVAFVNGGGIRAALPVDHTDPTSGNYVEGAKTGDITYGDILAVHPYGNYLTVIEATGQEIIDALELSASFLPNPDGTFQHVSGVEFKINCAIPTPVTLDPDSGMLVSIEGERRVFDATIGGEPIDPDATYIVASHDYMLKNAGGGFTMFEGNTLLMDAVMLDNQVLINYITDELGGVVGEQYAEPQGRITRLGVDVDPTSEAASAISRLFTEGLMQGKGDGIFAPNEYATVAEMCQILYNYFGAPEFETEGGAWWSTAVEWAQASGYVVADPNALVSDAALAAMLGEEVTDDIDSTPYTRAEVAVEIEKVLKAR